MTKRINVSNAAYFSKNINILKFLDNVTFLHKNRFNLYIIKLLCDF